MCKRKKARSLSIQEKEVNGQPVQIINIDSDASRTAVDKKLVPCEDIEKEIISVTFGNGAEQGTEEGDYEGEPGVLQRQENVLGKEF